MHMKKTKVAYVTGTRADFGLMTSILKAISESQKLELQIYATGVHLMPEFGLTIEQVRKEFPGTKEIPATFESDTSQSMAKFTGDFLGELVRVFSQDPPDFVLTLGDRPEMLCTAVACLYLGIPVGHVHGGERTSTVDELARHAITKLAHVHFPATEESAARIRKMGEDAWRIHVVGAPALDTILNEKLPTREALFAELNLDPTKQVILITQHPVSGEVDEAGVQMEETIEAVKSFNLPTVITYPHADAGGRKMIEVIDREKTNPMFRVISSMGYTQFLALVREAAVWIGNSSGALIESSSFKTPVVNIGTRQIGRQRGENVLDVGYAKEGIIAAIEKSLHDAVYRDKLQKVKNPWGDGKTGPRVARILEDVVFDSKLLRKQISY